MIQFQFSVRNDVGNGCTTVHQIDTIVADIEEAIEKGREAAVLIRAFSDAFSEEWESD